ncbi:hypothetical protein CAPTEDRAFT_99617 [Capitella teleta]|uniref:Protein kinase domain-containing protein n=1 Tax=Capitella teleta TaxID=283909 RepID=R7TJD4_CAPTE|nr:hypothetical protein CAPTEDRAFT_99617 [Capitella teleta]|eukprot:ELT93794.1 hypothetical protein CAPTEDRAFT_99617 [Capitella teleta]
MISITDTETEHEKHCLMQELDLMTSLLPHPNVLQLFGYCQDTEPPMLVMEYPVYGSLVEYLRDLRKSYTHVTIAGHNNFSLTHELMSFATQIARGMAYLASLKILHRDLAARSILLGEGKHCKITSFGEAQTIIDTHHYDKVCKARQAIRWMAPESIFQEDFSPKSDIWSFGILLWEIVTLGATPYSNLQASQVMKHVKKGHVLVSPPHCKPQLFSVMCKCWLIRPTTRPNFELLAEILQALHEESADLIQLEKYPADQYFILDPNRPDEIV